MKEKKENRKELDGSKMAATWELMQIMMDTTADELWQWFKETGYKSFEKWIKKNNK